MFNLATNSISSANQALTKTQEQLSTGQRVNRPSDDPVAATKIMSLSSELATITQYQKNIDIANNNLVLEESILQSVNNLVLRMQELAIQAGNTATLTETEYDSLASEVDSRLDELVNLLNSQNANGDFIFAGYKSQSEPFTGSADTGFRYNGDDGQQFIKVANNTSVASSDSGKDIFLDIASDNNTVRTYASPANTSNPPVNISVGRVVNQETYDDFYPEDIIVTFNADNNVVPPGKNFTATERSTGRTLIENEPYSPGNEIVVEGVSFRVSGTPVSGDPAEPATRVFGSEGAVAFPFDFTATPESFDITVAGRTETFVVDANVTSWTDLAAILNSGANGNGGNLAALGLTADSTGIRMPEGIDFSIRNGSANIDGVMGLDSVFGSSSTDGVRETAGDRVFIDATNRQDILTTLSRFSDAMKSFDGSSESRSDLASTVASTIANLTHSQTSVLEVTAKLGARFNTLQSTESLHLDTELVTQRVLANLRDTDYAEAATQLSAQSLILQAAQSSFIRVSQLSLISQL